MTDLENIARPANQYENAYRSMKKKWQIHKYGE